MFFWVLGAALFLSLFVILSLLAAAWLKRAAAVVVDI
jgi:hypothetical protein